MSHLLPLPCWEIADGGGIRVRYTAEDLDLDTATRLVETLSERAVASGQALLYLDLGPVHFLPSLVISKLFSLDRRLRALGGRLVLCNLNPFLAELLPAVGWRDTAPPSAGPA